MSETGFTKFVELAAAAENHMELSRLVTIPTAMTQLDALSTWLRREGVSPYDSAIPQRIAAKAISEFGLKSKPNLDWCFSILGHLNEQHVQEQPVVTDGLNDRQRRFVDAYLGEANCCKTKAARIAGYASPESEGSRLFAYPMIRTAITHRMRELAIPTEEILARLSEQARATISDFGRVDEAGRWVIDLKEAQASGKIRLVKKLTVGRAGEVTIELHDAQVALLALAKRLEFVFKSVEDLMETKADHNGKAHVG